ncbi:DUF6318 family protein [Nocardioides zeae]
MVCRGGRLVALVVGTSLVAACSGGGGEAEGSPGPSSPSSESSSESPAPPVPVMPEEARGDDDAAAVAFVEHWVELVNYAIRTGETAPLEAVTGPNCGTCDVLYEDLAGRGGEDATGRWTLMTSEVRRQEPADLGPADVIVESAMVIGEASGAEGSVATGLDWSDSGWVLSWATADPS